MSLPQQLKSARLSNATLASSIDDEIGNLEKALGDMLGIPMDTNITAAFLECLAGGLKTIKMMDAAADPAIAGDLQRNGAKLRFHTGTSVQDLTTPTGVVVAFAGATAPEGWLFCDGTPVSRTAFADLFAVIGTAYGVGDGSTTFTLPNLKGRVPFGVDATQAEFNALGVTGGAKTQAHQHAHAHSHHLEGATSTAPQNIVVNGGSAFGLTSAHAHTVSLDTWDAAPNVTDPATVPVLNPFLVLGYIIKA